MNQRELNPRQQAALRGVFEHKQYAVAGAEAGYRGRRIKQTVCDLVHSPRGKAFLADLDIMADDTSIATVKERKERLSEAIRAKVTDFVIDGEIRVPKGATNTGAIRKLSKRTRKIGGAIVSEEFTEIELLDPVSSIRALNDMEGIGRDSPLPLPANKVEVLIIGTDALSAALRSLVECGAIKGPSSQPS